MATWAPDMEANNDDPLVYAPADPRDDAAVEAFAVAMKRKMALSRLKGRDGWQQCGPAELWRMLYEHVEKGDPVDIGNLAMMIWANSIPAKDPTA